MLNNVSLTIPHNSMIAVVGESGSGKTTISNLILQLDIPSSGDIIFHGESVYKFKKIIYRIFV